MTEEIVAEGPPLRGRIVASQEWRDATFLHWRIEPARVGHLLPRGIIPDVHDGATWVGLIAFRLEDARIGRSPSFGRWGTFTEVNVRLYGVDPLGRRGVVFRSLEAASLPAVLAARSMFSLPYNWARTGERHGGDRLHSAHEYASRRHVTDARFDLRVNVDGREPIDTDTTRFLTARWALFQRRRGRTLWLPNTHEPWVLFPGEVARLDENLLARAGVPGLSAPPDSVVFSPGVRALFGKGERLDA